jgi:translation initiation factor IF-1
MVHQCFCKKKSFNEHKTNEVLKSIWERMKLNTFKNTLLNKKWTFAYIMARLRIHIQRKKGRWHKIYKTLGLNSKTNEVLKSIWERMKLNTFKNTLSNKKWTFAYIMARLRIHIQRKKGRWRKIYKTLGLNSSFLDVKCRQWCWWVDGDNFNSQSHTKQLVLPH